MTKSNKSLECTCLIVIIVLSNLFIDAMCLHSNQPFACKRATTRSVQKRSEPSMTHYLRKSAKRQREKKTSDEPRQQ